MISDWTSERGLAAIEKMGWPEWEEDYHGDEGGETERFRLLLAPDGAGIMRPWAEYCGDGEWDGVENMGRKPALALLQKHAREWLDERKIRVQRDWRRGGWRIIRSTGQVWCCTDWEYADGGTTFPTYNLAQIAAIEAAEDDHATE